MKAPKSRSSRRLGHLWSFFLPVYFFAAATFDFTEVTNSEYLKYVVATRHSPPEHWGHGRVPTGKENDPVVMVNFTKRLRTAIGLGGACRASTSGSRPA